MDHRRGSGGDGGDGGGMADNKQHHTGRKGAMKSLLLDENFVIILWWAVLTWSERLTLLHNYTKGVFLTGFFLTFI